MYKIAMRLINYAKKFATLKLAIWLENAYLAPKEGNVNATAAYAICVSHRTARVQPISHATMYKIAMRLINYAKKFATLKAIWLENVYLAPKEGNVNAGAATAESQLEPSFPKSCDP
ncbi:hypothetical protein ISN44_As12g002170 [Arabidopsis suecica]|uniref:Uncharacterized protein n=1 Tax=Arabidopsis suecica TaxID=45249 RepID=A0A8T1YER2_ARASU|nr:hypothetical protein ISN44_As12g002170 [Arabidopsis suecica]